MVSIWPPVMWFSKAPIAVVTGGDSKLSRRRAAAAIRPAIRPTAALST